MRYVALVPLRERVNDPLDPQLAALEAIQESDGTSMIHLPLLDYVNTQEQRRGAVRLLSWMLDKYGEVIEPAKVDPMAFVQWMLDENNAVRGRYASLWLKDERLAVAYRGLVEASKSGPVDWTKIWDKLSAKDRAEVGGKSGLATATFHLRIRYGMWVGRDAQDRLWVKPTSFSPQSAAAYCGWVAMLWEKIEPERVPEWYQARNYARSMSLQKNATVRWPEYAMKACDKIAEKMGKATLLASRDAWLFCGLCLLGLTASEIAKSRREHLSFGVGGHLRVLVPTRKEAGSVVVGPAAASWLHRFEGFLNKKGGDVGEALLQSGAPLWPSLARWGSGKVKDYSTPLWGDSVKMALRRMDDAGTLRVLTLRHLCEAAMSDAGASRTAIGRLMGRRTPGIVETSPEDDDLRLRAQAILASKLGLHYV